MTDDGQTEAFPAADFDNPELKLPQVDGKKVNQIGIRFSGNIVLDRTNVEHVAFFRDMLKLGAEVDFDELGRLLYGTVQQKPSRQAATKEGYAGDVKQTAVVKIHTIGGFGGAPAGQNEEEEE